MKKGLVASCRGDLLHSLLAANVRSTAMVLQDMLKRMEQTDLVQEKGTEICVLDTSQTHSKDLCWAVSHTWRASQRARSSEGPVPHPGLLAIGGFLAVRLAQNLGQAHGRVRHFPGRGKGAVPCFVWPQCWRQCAECGQCENWDPHRFTPRHNGKGRLSRTRCTKLLFQPAAPKAARRWLRVPTPFKLYHCSICHAVVPHEPRLGITAPNEPRSAARPYAQSAPTPPGRS